METALWILEFTFWLAVVALGVASYLAVGCMWLIALGVVLDSILTFAWWLRQITTRRERAVTGQGPVSKSP